MRARQLTEHNVPQKTPDLPITSKCIGTIIKLKLSTAELAIKLIEK